MKFGAVLLSLVAIWQVPSFCECFSAGAARSAAFRRSEATKLSVVSEIIRECGALCQVFLCALFVALAGARFVPGTQVDCAVLKAHDFVNFVTSLARQAAQ